MISTDSSVQARATRLLLGLRRAPDPYEVYDRLRELGAVLPVPALRTVVLCGYDVCRHALRSPDFRVPDPAWRDLHTPGWRRHPSAEQYAASLLNTNAPGHQALRSRSAALVSRPVIAALRSTVRELADDCAGRLASVVSREGVADAVEHLVLPLPARVLCALLDLPDEDAAYLAELTLRNQMVGELFPTETDFESADRALADFQSYLRALRRRIHPGGAPPAWSRVTPAECGLLLQAGFSTTFALLGTAMRELLKDGGALAATLLARPELIPDAVETWLRHCPPSAMVSRIPSRDTVLAGVPVAAQTHLLVLIAAATRDPAAVGTLSFGHGPKYCLGAHLARLEAVAFVRAVLPYAVTWRLAGPPPPTAGYVMPQLRSLHVTARRATAPPGPAPDRRESDSSR
ncbi:cytochrome P450 [Streptomyces sp. NPDC006012]|uniref:cytochrome P450 n=1 Tax=Streptomyces sp. NPDC006012 TaxID=3364739 RepID=UPI0036AB754D